MPRGKRPIDPSMLTDFDLMDLRDALVQIKDGVSSPVSVIHLARITEGLVFQYRSKVAANQRTSLDQTARTSIEHALGFDCIARGERMAIDRLLALGDISPTAHEQYREELDAVVALYCKVGAAQTLGLMDQLTAMVGRVGKGPGRPKGQKQSVAQDFAILQEVGLRLTPERGDPEDWTVELRSVLREMLEKGLIPERGSTKKETIDIHARRLAGLPKSKKSRLT